LTIYAINFFSSQTVRAKNKGKIFFEMKTSDFTLHGRKSKLVIKIDTKNVFYPLFVLIHNFILISLNLVTYLVKKKYLATY
jgi:hypothetical protein